jgi:pseudouridine-5'-phosphate glycosidase
VRGKDVTPFLLDRFATETKGESLRVNRLIILNNARVAARVAGAHAALAAERS